MTASILKDYPERAFPHVLIYSTLLYLLLKDYMEKLDRVVIDREYTGHEALIKDRVMALCGRRGVSVNRDQVVFDWVGKKSPAHKLAYRAYKGVMKPDRLISASEVLAELGE